MKKKENHQHATLFKIPWILSMLFFLMMAFNTIQGETIAVEQGFSRLGETAVFQQQHESDNTGFNPIISLEFEEKEEEKQVENQEYDGEAASSNQAPKNFLYNISGAGMAHYLSFTGIEKTPLYILFHCLKTGLI